VRSRKLFFLIAALIAFFECCGAAVGAAVRIKAHFSFFFIDAMKKTLIHQHHHNFCLRD
jgi:hypothetical protein